MAGKSEAWIKAYPWWVWVGGQAGGQCENLALLTAGKCCCHLLALHPHCSSCPPSPRRIAYCAPFLGGMQQSNCGRCLRLTNLRTGTAEVSSSCMFPPGAVAAASVPPTFPIEHSLSFLVMPYLHRSCALLMSAAMAAWTLTVSVCSS